MLAGWVMVKFQYPFSLFCHTDSYESHALAYTRQVQYAAVCCYERNLMEGAETLYGCRTVFTVSQQVQNSFSCSAESFPHTFSSSFSCKERLLGANTA